MKLPGVIVTASELVSAGSFTPSAGNHTISNLPPFCRVSATLKPAPDSNIRIELWMPEKGWNRRFLGTGNGGGAGRISYSALAWGLRRRFATANTDMGTSPNADAVVGHPERWADFGYRATHDMTAVSKKLIEKYYRGHQRRSYFVGCSTGGQQALMEAQRFPTDYNGIIAGAPANNRTHLHTGFLWNLQAMNETPASSLSPKKIALITKSVLVACAGKDGGSPSDDFLTDPRSCKFDPGTIPACHGADNGECLTEAQIAALKRVYAGPTNPRTGQRIYTPIPPGSENSPFGLSYQEAVARVGTNFYLYRWVFGADFNYRKFDFDRDQDVIDAKLASILNANNPDVSGMRKRGGKILMFTGTADPLVPFQDTLNYYERVVRAEQIGGGKERSSRALARTQEFFRYFLVPGMGHCTAGPGLTDFGQMPTSVSVKDSDHDVLSALVKWVEQGVAPDKIIATAFVDGTPAKGIRLQRPICPYPKFPNYVGGDWKSPSSYRCTDHPRGEVLVPADKYLN
jgi:feruloyl esterase